MEGVSASRVETSAVARHIAREAARLFASHGYDATSVRMIVEAAGVTKPTLYYYFGSKEGLARALLTVPMDRLVRALRGTLAEASDPVEILARTFETHFAFAREDPDRARFAFALLFGPSGSALVPELERCGDEFAGLMAAAVQPLVEAGVVAGERGDACASACRALVVHAMMDFLYKGGDLGPGLGHRLVGDLLSGFAEPGTWGRGRSS
jgi:AcrR family transcriptional regulator